MTVHDTPFGTNESLVGTDVSPAGTRSGRQPADRRPESHDYVVFFVALPLLFAFWASAIGMAPAPVLGFANGCLYIATQVMAAWWANAFGSHLACRLLRPWRPPLWLVLVTGFWLMWIPLSIFYQGHFWFFGLAFPAIREAMQGPDFSWTLDYFAQLLRYSTPFLPLWMAAVYGYRALGGVLWFSPPPEERPAQAAPPPAGLVAKAAVPVAHAVPVSAPPKFLAASRIPADAIIFAIKAEEHYIRVWADRGTDLVRYRFKDALEELAGLNGAQIHRSWWINWDCVTGNRRRGRSVNLMLSNGLVVPVSLAHKAEASRRTRAKTG